MKFRSHKDRLVFYVCLATMVNVGIPFERALRSLLEKSEDENEGIGFLSRFLPVDFRPGHENTEVITFLYKKISTGSPISDAIKAAGDAFPRYVAGTIRAAEESGSLDTALNAIALTEEKEYQVRQKLKKSLMYPLIVGGLGLSLLWILALFLGSLREVFEDQNIHLPVYLDKAIDIADWFFNPFVIMALVALVYLGRRKLAQPDFQRKLQDFSWFWVPVFSDLTFLSANIQFCRLLAMQLRAGCSLLPALTRALLGTDDKILIYHADAKQTGTIVNKIINGTELSRALELSGYFSKNLLSMIRVAEEHGNLEKTLDAVADFLQDEIDYRLDTFTTLVEPIFISITGLCVGLAAIGTFMPLLEVMKF